MIDLITFKKIVNEVYRVNAANGWHDSPRTLAELYALIHTEPGEVTEAYRRGGVADDKLPQYPGEAVEFIDTIMRIFDFIGSKSIAYQLITSAHLDSARTLADVAPLSQTFHTLEVVNEVHYLIATAYRVHTSQTGSWVEPLLAAAMLCSDAVSQMGFNPQTVLDMKLDYNRKRADHKRENRKNKGQKLL